MVLNGGGDDVLVLLAEPLGCAENSPVVRFGAAGGKKDPIMLRAHSGGNLNAGVAQGVGGLDAEAVQRAGIGPAIG